MGWVGKAMFTLFPESLIQDPHQKLISEEYADVSFICVPTNLKDGKLDCSVVEEVVRNCSSELIIIRSTVMPGTCDKLEKLGKNIVFQPEYLGETTNHPLTDQKARPFLVL
jgi:UDP-glucose 6-dehydrogenase